MAGSFWVYIQARWGKVESELTLIVNVYQYTLGAGVIFFFASDYTYMQSALVGVLGVH